MFEQFVFIKSLVPRFLRNFTDGLKGDFNDHPEARAYIWPMFFVGFLSLGLAFYAAHLGYPLYVELLEDTAAPHAFAAVLVFLISGVIFTCSQILGMYIVENRKHGISRTDGGRIQWIALLLFFMISYDLFMNHGGQTLRLVKSKGSDIARVTNVQFSFARQSELDALTNDIYKIEHPKEIGCKGHAACRLTCPINPKGSLHNPTGSLTRFGRSLLADKREEKTSLEAERKTALDRFNTGAASALSEAEAVADKKDRASKWTVLGLYLVMFLACTAGAALDLAFEDAAGISLDYNALAEDQLLRAQKQRDDKNRRIQERKARENERKILARERAKERREMRRNGLKPGKYAESKGPYPIKEADSQVSDKVAQLEKMISELTGKNPEAEKGKPAPDSDHLAELKAYTEELRKELNDTKTKLNKERQKRFNGSGNGQTVNGKNLNGQAFKNSIVGPVAFKLSNGNGSGNGSGNGQAVNGSENGPVTVETVTVSTVGNGFEIMCSHCGKTARKKSPRAKFCSDACRMAAYNDRTKNKKLNIDGLT